MANILKKTQNKSFFVNCHKGSSLAEKLLNNKPKFKGLSDIEKPCTILQLMEINEWLYIELIYEEDYICIESNR